MVKLTIVIAYVLVMLAVGYLCMRKTHTVGDFFLGGRSIGPWMSAFAFGTTYFSAVLFIGYAGRLGWGYGLHTMWIVAGNAIVGCLLAWIWIGPRTRTMTARLNAMTLPDFMAVRYQCPFLKILSALIIFVFLVPYSSSVYMGLSYLFETNMHLSYLTALIFMAALTGVYLMMGGYFALTITDFIRGIIEWLGVVIMVVYLTSQKGGFIEATSNLMNPAYSPALNAPGPIPGWLTLGSLVLITSFGPWCLPQMVQKFYSIKSERDIKIAALVCTLFSIAMAFGAYYTGALTHLYYEKPPQNMDELIPMFLTEHTPAAISMVILLLVFSASMSSLSSLVLVSSSAIALDLYSGVINPKASKKSIMALMRVLCGVFVAISLWIALKQPTFIVNLMVISWGVLAGSFIGPYLYGLFWKGTTKAGAISGMLLGLFLSIGLYFVLGKPGIPLAGAISMIAPLIATPVVSLMTKPFSQEHLTKVFGE